MLPPYPRRVTELPSIKVNRADQRSASAYVQAVLQLPISDRRYLRDQYGTKCNFFTIDVTHVMGYDEKFRRAKDIIKEWRANFGPTSIIKMVLQDAITNANMGCPTFAGVDVPGSDTDHVMVVLPQPPTTRAGEVVIANVGATNFYGRQLKYAVPKALLAQVEFFGGP